MTAPYQPAKAWIEKDGQKVGETVSPNQHWPIYYENKRLEVREQIFDQYFASGNYTLWVPHCPSGSVYFDPSHQLSVSMGWSQGSCWTGNEPNPNYGYALRGIYTRYNPWQYTPWYTVRSHYGSGGMIYGIMCAGNHQALFQIGDGYFYPSTTQVSGHTNCGGSPYLAYATPSAGLANWNLVPHSSYPSMRGMPWNHGTKNEYTTTAFDLMYWEDYGRGGNINKIGEWRDTELLTRVTPGGALNPTIPNCLANAQSVIPCPPSGHIFCGDDPSFPAPGNYCCLNCEQTASKLKAIDSRMKGVSSAAAGKAAQLDAAFKKITEMWDEI